MFRSVWDQIHYAGFLLGIFSGGKIYCYANFFCYAIVFGPNFREGQKFSRGENCLRGCTPSVEESQYGMDTICLHRTGSNLSSIVPYGITFISGPIWYQRADLIHTGSTWSHVNMRLTNTNFILFPKGSSPCKCYLNLWPLGILATLNSRFFS